MPLIDGIKRKAVPNKTAIIPPEPVIAPQPVTAPEPVKVPQPAETAGGTTHVTSFADLHPKRKIITMVGVILAMLLAALDQTIVGTALPRIVRELGGADHLTWVVTAYLLASTVTVPIYGKLSDLYGRKWFIFGGISLFLVGSMLCGLSQNMTELIIFRAIQGIGGGAIMGNAFAIIADLFEPAERARWQGVLGGVFGLSSVIGPALGGFITDHASWRWVFYINLPLGILALIFIGFLMPKVASTIKDKIIDYWGAGLLVGTLVPLLLALSFGGRDHAWNSPFIISLFAIGFASLIGFLFAEQHSKEPIMPLSLFKNSIFTTAVSITFLTSAAMFGAIIYIPIFGQLVQNVSATSSGTMLTPLMIGLIGASVVAGQLISRTGKYRFIALVGAAMLVLSLLWLSTITAHTTQLELVMRMVALGISLGLTMPVFNIAVQNAFEQSKIGVVTASTQLFRSIGGTVGTAVLGAVFNNTLAQKAPILATTAFAKASAGHGPSVADPNVLQGLLSSQGQAKIHATAAALPAPAQASVLHAFSDYLTTAKDIYASSISHLFLIGALVASVALVITLFFKEIPLRGSKQTANTDPLGEAGNELAVELGQSESAHEPVLGN